MSWKIQPLLIFYVIVIADFAYLIALENSMFPNAVDSFIPIVTIPVLAYLAWKQEPYYRRGIA